MLKSTHIHWSILIQKIAIFDSDSKKSILFQTIHSDITTYNHRFFFRRIRMKLIFQKIFLWSESYFWKHSFLFRGFLIIKTTFSYIQECSKIQRQRNIISKKTKSKILLNINTKNVNTILIHFEFDVRINHAPDKHEEWETTLKFSLIFLNDWMKFNVCIKVNSVWLLDIKKMWSFQFLIKNFYF